MRRLAVVSIALVMALGLNGVVPATASATDVGPWIYNPVTRHTYAQVNGVTWADAESYGARVGGHLVTVDNEAEQLWLTETFPDGWQWIGLNDRAHEGVWVWSSGRRVTYTAWADGEPDDWKGFDPLGEDAAVLSGPGPGWITISERWLGNGIVEVPGKPKDLSWNQLPWGSHDGSPLEVAPGDECYAAGWAWDPDSQRRDVTVRILATRQDITIVPKVIWQAAASDIRDDLPQYGIDLTAGFGVDLRGLIEWGLPYEIRVQGQDLQTGEWQNLDATPRLITCVQ